MQSTYDVVAEIAAPLGHWERVAAEVMGLALLRDVRLPSEALEWLDIRELLALRTVLLESYRGAALRQRLARIPGMLVPPSIEQKAPGMRT